MRFVGICKIQAGPQRGARNENIPPTATYVGHLDQIFVSLAVFPVVWNEGKNIGRDSVDEREGVPH